MKLFLTSYAAHSLDKVVPLLGSSPKMLKVAFIPTASDAYRYRPWVDDDRQMLLKLGFKVFQVGLQAQLSPDGFPVLDSKKNESELRMELAEADILFVGGGNTFYLLEQAQKSGFLQIAKEMVEEGTIYIGSSAGSILAGPDIAPAEFFDDPSEANAQGTVGLGFVDFIIQPHYDPTDPAFKRAQEKYKDEKFIPLDNSKLVFVDENEYKII